VRGVKGQLDQIFEGSDSQKDGGPLGGSRSGENDLVVGNTCRANKIKKRKMKKVSR
jgi:hypothetical protein